MKNTPIDKLDQYSRQKADEVFCSLPYTVADKTELLNFIERRKGSEKITLKRAITIARNIAAILFLPLLVCAGYLFYNIPDSAAQFASSQNGAPASTTIQIDTIIPRTQETAWVEYLINPGVKGKILLPDSSEVWVNSKSHIKCPATFSQEIRRVILSGEAYFKVKSNKEWPMCIETPQGVTAMVLGTEFNMTAYEDDQSVTITLVNGKVEVLKETDSNPSEKIVLKPFEEVEIFNSSKKEDKKIVDFRELDNTSAWKDGYLVFSNTPMEEVIKIMERWYGVTFNPIDAEIAKFNFTARFKTESLTQILDLLSISSNIKYKIKENKVTLYR